MTKKYTVAIVGMGSIGSTHARALQSVDGVELIAYSGGTRESGGECGWPQARWETHENLLRDENVDIVVICSPTKLHGAAAITVATSGRHVVVEKPMTLSAAEADALVELQRAGPGIVAMVSQRRFETEYATVKHLMESGDLGELRLALTQVPWFRGSEYFTDAPWRARAPSGGGSLVNQGVHNLDLMQWICGGVTSVTAQSTSQSGTAEAEDTLAATVKFDSGALGLIATSTATPPGFQATLTLHTTRGRIELGQGEVLCWEMEGVPRPPGGGGVASGAADPAAIGLTGHIAVWSDVLAAIREGRRPLVDAVEGAKVTQLLCAIHEAAETGHTVTLPGSL